MSQDAATRTTRTTATANESTTRHRGQPRRRGAGGGAGRRADHPEFSVAPSRGRRRGAFDASLTPAASSSSPTSSKPPKRPHVPLSPDADLTTSLIHTLSTHPYADCAICFGAIHPAQPIWSCSPSAHDAPQCCWTPFHLKCIQSWASKSLTDLRDAWRARGELGHVASWRCPGCQTPRETVPGGYRCFCGSTPAPTASRLATPHSCGQACSRRRGGRCTHVCPLECHPGPCPPCRVTLTQRCLCGKTQVLVKCSSQTDEGAVIRCDTPCALPLPECEHPCTSGCHTPPCPPCTQIVQVPCLCGKEEREVVCSERPPSARCEQLCNRPFPCGEHTCASPCHTHTAPTCPSDPAVLSTCPCGAHALVPSSRPVLSSSALILPRTQCTDPVPTCSSPCSKPLPPHLCSSPSPHPCHLPCHTGPCPAPCSEVLNVPCRCGASTRPVVCGDLVLEDAAGVRKMGEIVCDRPCQALRNCGHHKCNRLCCPLAPLASSSSSTTSSKKGKKKQQRAEDEPVWFDPEGLHVCDLPCNRPLSCGLHRCAEKDHPGRCGPCMRSNFDSEVICQCGLTVLDPPIPCGTILECPHPCTRPPPPCGHPRNPHACHGEQEAGGGQGQGQGQERNGCPPCVFLTNRVCACGKKEVPNVKCSLARTRVSCGSVCGKTLECGYHTCPQLCHTGPCSACLSPCNKPRKSCLAQSRESHACTLPCHAPSACPEDKDHPCEARVILTCECGRIKVGVRCGNYVGAGGGGGGRVKPKCTAECKVMMRNARLAEALGIDTSSSPSSTSPSPSPSVAGTLGTVVWKDDLVHFARSQPKFLILVEKAFAEFVLDSGAGGGKGRKTQVLPHMPVERRKFVIDVAAVYRMDTQMVDQEPHRSVQIIRRIDTRIPNPSLSTFISSSSSSLSVTRTPGITGLATSRSSSPLPPSTPWGKSSTSTGTSSSTSASASSPYSWRPSATASTTSRSGTPAPAPVQSLDPSSSAAAAATAATCSGSGAGAWTSRRVAAEKEGSGSGAAVCGVEGGVVMQVPMPMPVTEDWEDDDEI